MASSGHYIPAIHSSAGTSPENFDQTKYKYIGLCLSYQSPVSFHRPLLLPLLQELEC